MSTGIGCERNNRSEHDFRYTNFDPCDYSNRGHFETAQKSDQIYAGFYDKNEP